MIVELVQFRAPEGASWEAILADAKGTVPRWSGNPELVRKHYLRGASGDLAGLYIWPSREAAERAHDDEWRAAVARRTGSAPRITYFDLMMLLDNEAGSLTEWGEDGSRRVLDLNSAVGSGQAG